MYKSLNAAVSKCINCCFVHLLHIAVSHEHRGTGRLKHDTKYILSIIRVNYTKNAIN